MMRERHQSITGIYVVNGRPFFPINWLHKQEYCEYQIYLENFIGVRAELTLAMKLGRGSHRDLEQAHEERATEFLTIPQAIEKTSGDGIERRAREFFVWGGKSGIFGKIDEAVISRDMITVIDDKPGKVPWNSNKTQVMAYCLAFLEHYTPGIPLTGMIRDRDTGDPVWEEEFTSDAMERIRGRVMRIQNLISGMEEFKSSTEPGKCMKCRFSIGGKCDRSLASMPIIQ